MRRKVFRKRIRFQLLVDGVIYTQHHVVIRDKVKPQSAGIE